MYIYIVLFLKSIHTYWMFWLNSIAKARNNIPWKCTIFQRLWKTETLKNEEFSYIQTLSCCIYHADKCYNANNCWHCNINENDIFHAQLSWAWKRFYILRARSDKKVWLRGLWPGWTQPSQRFVALSLAICFQGLWPLRYVIKDCDQVSPNPSSTIQLCYLKICFWGLWPGQTSHKKMWPTCSNELCYQ